MKYEREVHVHYQKAYALAKKELFDKKKLRMPLFPVALKALLDERNISRKQDLGVLEIPLNLIVGTAEDTQNRMLYTKEFLPVSVPASDYAERWCSLWAGIHTAARYDEAISCYEYLGKFYVRDGMKRVSVAKYAGASCISAHVVRILPVRTEEHAVAVYYDFLFQYRLTKLYQLQFTQPGFFEELQLGLGLDPKHRWNGRDRTYFLACWSRVEHAFQKSFENSLHITAADALVVLMKKYSFAQIASMESWVLARVFQTLWKELHALSMSVKSASAEASAEAVPQSA